MCTISTFIRKWRCGSTKKKTAHTNAKERKYCVAFLLAFAHHIGVQRLRSFSTGNV